ncbi:MAG: hydrogenase maturation nickel metallochaperone HypA [Bdellovibrionales bacterium RIFOXYD12_FULL_39_22]|nr:MAG: hydrogenase maturation nickel metallochaperone HypA [Bdellovibrionales bacterium RIFOXYB1_FULL_39_21]OFZ45023.1 MAG: hydrogenase maturation nickel metallochaperone HypA [Bdellovibrionales bacterium RIFOXYC12_FULL_39_17]OFZ49461.1 MAG: hydrogenase maturation nickel metallochaperone HypA [Bdellovibrionales bacterium RIFOXYC1_FULL_39_130]OFZ70295.1 MAG: hydrogenase maturation nickel metallochaperone HypA [Bdellovibrionales bacterium RIFOXYC2_FULL_39_8]OFZ77200.1 MAG: hydrogenase maturation
MHELALAQSLIETVNDLAIREHFKKVISLTISVGKLSGVDSDSLSFCLNEVVKNSILEQAKLYFEDVPIKIRCTSCKKESILDEFLLDCPNCHSLEVSVISGREFYIKDLEVEDV